jgi:hypothetical protein
MSCGIGFYQYIFTFLIICSLVFLGLMFINICFLGYQKKSVIPVGIVFLMLFGFFASSSISSGSKLIERIDPACNRSVPTLKR